MSSSAHIVALSQATEALLGPPFEWCHVPGGSVTIENTVATGGTSGGAYQIADFAIAKYPITNAQYQRFLDDPNGYANLHWWAYSSAAAQWRNDHPEPKPTAFDGAELPRTRVSWFDSLAFCHWLSVAMQTWESTGQPNAVEVHDLATWRVRLPTEQEWQRAALGDTTWLYPWGSDLDETRGNYGRRIGHPTRVGSYPQGQSPYNVMDMVGNVWEWCMSGWGADGIDVAGYTYRLIKGGAWNVSNPDHLRAADRGGNSPRGCLNDCGFRCVYSYRSSTYESGSRCAAA